MVTPKPDALQRLRYIEGHVRGIGKMIEAGTPCVDVLRQTYVVRRALDKLDQVLLREHLEHRLPECIREGRDREVLDELAQVFELAHPRSGETDQQPAGDTRGRLGGEMQETQGGDDKRGYRS